MEDKSGKFATMSDAEVDKRCLRRETFSFAIASAVFVAGVFALMFRFGSMTLSGPELLVDLVLLLVSIVVSFVVAYIVLCGLDWLSDIDGIYEEWARRKVCGKRTSDVPTPIVS